MPLTNESDGPTPNRLLHHLLPVITPTPTRPSTDTRLDMWRRYATAEPA